MQSTMKEAQWRRREEQMSRIKEHARFHTENSFSSGAPPPEKRDDTEETEEMIILDHKRLERCVKMGNVLSGESKQLLKDVLHQNSDVFAWPGVGVNLHGLLELDKSGLNGNKDRVQLGTSRGQSFVS
ncbi:hypothetical protein Tco_0202522, partial [Tanacetum coccineum]